MTRRRPKATIVEIADCGHAPTLSDDEHTDIVMNWLARQPLARQDIAARVAS
jgi:hypothetical protein